MEDQKINPKLILKIIIGIIAAIILVITYRLFMTNTNTKKYENYLLKNRFELKEDNTYHKQTTNNNMIINYYVYNDTSIMTKEIINNSNNSNNSLGLKYENNIIYATYSIEGKNNDGNYDTAIQKSEYNVKNQNYSCKIIIDGHFDDKCSEMKKESIKFNDEIQKILSQNNLKIKYIK